MVSFFSILFLPLHTSIVPLARARALLYTHVVVHPHSYPSRSHTCLTRLVYLPRGVADNQAKEKDPTRTTLSNSVMPRLTISNRSGLVWYRGLTPRGVMRGSGCGDYNIMVWCMYFVDVCFSLLSLTYDR